jgi:hypothetical protein
MHSVIWRDVRWPARLHPCLISFWAASSHWTVLQIKNSAIPMTLTRSDRSFGYEVKALRSLVQLDWGSQVLFFTLFQAGFSKWDHVRIHMACDQAGKPEEINNLGFASEMRWYWTTDACACVRVSFCLLDSSSWDRRNPTDCSVLWGFKYEHMLIKCSQMTRQATCFFSFAVRSFCVQRPLDWGLIADSRGQSSR